MCRGPRRVGHFACDVAGTCDAAGACVMRVASAGDSCREATGHCDVAENCDGSSCTGRRLHERSPVECEDSDPCTTDMCAEPDGCAHAAIRGRMADAGGTGVFLRTVGVALLRRQQGIG